MTSAVIICADEHVEKLILRCFDLKLSTPITIKDRKLIYRTMVETYPSSLFEDKIYFKTIQKCEHTQTIRPLSNKRLISFKELVDVMKYDPPEYFVYHDMYNAIHTYDPMIPDIFKQHVLDDILQKRPLVAGPVQDAYDYVGVLLRRIQTKTSKNQANLRYPTITSSQRYFDLSQTKPVGHDIVVLAGGCGTGKTTSVVSYLKHYNFLSITYRVSLSNQQKAAFEQDNQVVGHYLDKKSMDSKRLIIQFDSIIKLTNSKTSYPFVYLDECSALLDYICKSTTFKEKRFLLYQMFVEYIRRAKQIIITDADITQREIEFIIQIRNKGAKLNKVIVYQNDHVRSRNVRAHVSYDDHQPFIERAKQIVEMTNDTIIITSDSKRMIDSLGKYLTNAPKGRVKIYTSKEGNVDEIAKDVNKAWKGKAILYSPSITTGVDFLEPAHVFCFFTGHSVTYPTIVQMVERTRNKLSLNLSITATSSPLRFYSKQHYIDETLRAIEKKSINHIHHNLQPYMKLNSNNKVVLDQNMFLEYLIGLLVKQHWEKHDLRRKILQHLCSIGYDVSEDTVNSDITRHCCDKLNISGGRCDDVEKIVAGDVGLTEAIVRIEASTDVRSQYVQQLFKVLNIRSFKCLKEIVIQHYFNKTILSTSNEIMFDREMVLSICDTFNITCRKTRALCEPFLWYDVMLLAVKVWKKHLGKDMISTNSLKRSRSGSLFKITYPVFRSEICDYLG